MSERFTIRPAAEGADIRDPETGDRLSFAGEDKPRTAYWIGLQIRGDVVELPPPEPQPEPPPPEPQPEPPQPEPQPEPPQPARARSGRSAD